jgi:hypothetical protein
MLEHLQTVTDAFLAVRKPNRSLLSRMKLPSNLIDNFKPSFLG